VFYPRINWVGAAPGYVGSHLSSGCPPGNNMRGVRDL